MECPNCNEETLYTVKVGKLDCCAKCKDETTAHKPKKKIGRPVTKTPEERKAKHDQWFIDNAEHRRKYQREYKRRKRAEKRAQYSKNGKDG